jgi:hypothetical protein
MVTSEAVLAEALEIPEVIYICGRQILSVAPKEEHAVSVLVSGVLRKIFGSEEDELHLF